jgi:hypothetical protein
MPDDGKVKDGLARADRDEQAALAATNKDTMEVIERLGSFTPEEYSLLDDDTLLRLHVAAHRAYMILAAKVGKEQLELAAQTATALDEVTGKTGGAEIPSDVRGLLIDAHENAHKLWANLAGAA